MARHKQSFRATVREIARLSLPYFRSEERWFAWGAVLAIICLSLLSVAIGVRLATWQRDFFNAMQQVDQPVWLRQLWIFGYITAGQVVIGMILIYVTQRLEIRWRSWMTRHFLDRWLARHAHYHMQMGAHGVDNPDQRISMDIPLFIQRTLHMTIGDRSLGPTSTGLLTAFATLFSFSVMLWTLSTQMPLIIGGRDYHVPGFLLWAALLYAGASTLVTHLFGRQLIGLRFDQQRHEADFRFDLVRVREHSEQIALLAGEPVEKRRLMAGFAHVARNWHALMMRQVKLTAITGSIAGVTMILPSLLVAPAFFARVVGYGELMQISTAFLSVQGALSFFVANYPLVAEWKSLTDRLGGLDRALDDSQGAADRIEAARRSEGAGFAAGPMRIMLPAGAPLIETEPLRLARGDSVLVSGPSGCGKSTTFRVLGGIWPHAEGAIRIPEGARMMVLPQRPYVPIGTLADALAFPLPAESWSPDMLRAVLEDVGLGALSPRLHEHGRWDRSLSGGEQQRVAIARALLHRPDYLLLDEATASLDEAAEAALYALLRKRLPDAAIMSIGHRATLAAFHARRLMVVGEGEKRRLVEKDPPQLVPASGAA